MRSSIDVSLASMLLRRSLTCSKTPSSRATRSSTFALMNFPSVPNVLLSRNATEIASPSTEDDKPDRGRTSRPAMNLMEYQGKELFKRVGIPVPRGEHALTPDAVAQFIEKNPGEWVVKAQVLMGGRGKAGKIKMASDAAQGRRV